MNGILTTAVLVGGLGMQRVGIGPASTCTGQSAVDLPVVLENQAGTALDVVRGAREQMAVIFQHAGVRVVWDADPRQLPRPLIALIVPDDRATALHIRDLEALGATLRTGTRGGTVYIFYGRVERAAAGHHVEAAAVLGSALAHEAAHAILGKDAHAHSGLLRASWDAQDFQLLRSGLLRFSHKERDALRNRLQLPPTEACRPSVGT
jgi:hypothetical protein